MTNPVPRVGAVPVPRSWTIRAGDVVVLAVGNGVLIGAMWIRHGGLEQLDSLGGILSAGGQLTALAGTYLALIALVLMSRSPWLEQRFGRDSLAAAHRLVGFTTIWLLLAHGVLTTMGYAMGDGSSVVGEAVTLLTTYPYVLMATAGMGLFVLVGVTSMKAARHRLSFETWWGVHLYVYLALALTLLHELVVGTDFSADPVARAYWLALYGVAGGLLLTFRVGEPVALSLRHRLRVANVVTEAPGVVSVYVTGRDMDRLAVRAGQYFIVRFLSGDGWWRAHPFSLSAAPNGAWLRLTIKELGDWTARLQRLQPGTRLFVEGPYGVMTGARRTRLRVVLIAGGIGITPLRALLEELPAAPGQVTLLYRTRDVEDLVFRDELDTLARLRGAAVHYLVGPRGRGSADPLSAPRIRALVPDIATSDVFLCGPDGMMEAVQTRLKALGVPAAHIHRERFA